MNKRLFVVRMPELGLCKKQFNRIKKDIQEQLEHHTVIALPFGVEFLGEFDQQSPWGLYTGNSTTAVAEDV